MSKNILLTFALAAALSTTAAFTCRAATDSNDGSIRAVSPLAASGMRGSVKMVCTNKYYAEDMAMDGSIDKLEVGLESEEKKIFDRNGYVTYDSVYTDGQAFLSMMEYDGTRMERYAKYFIESSTENEFLVEEKLYTYRPDGNTDKFVFNIYTITEDGRNVKNGTTDYLHHYTGSRIDSVVVKSDDGHKTYVFRKLDDNGSYEYTVTNATGSFEYDAGTYTTRYDASQRLVYEGSAEFSDNYTYDDRGDVISNVSGNDENREKFTMRYTDYDAQGNWTKAYMFSETDGEKVCINVMERKITYWE